ncbi:velvet factor-domain-containing protein [Lipomyces kononenkoae]|uniref:Velvet factor-domain-containing protein n=1 Tax=Lipomyces kononenkoae TaxID=34357 RepID=A0ACC3T5B1_LIPKO
MHTGQAESYAGDALQLLSAPLAHGNAAEQTQSIAAANPILNAPSSNARLRPLHNDAMPAPEDSVYPTWPVKRQVPDDEPATELMESHTPYKSQRILTTSRSDPTKEREHEPKPRARRPQDMDGPPCFSSYTAQFYIVQQPDRARACGNADRDRRCLDPPPVLKLEVRSLATGEVDIQYMKRYSWIVQCFLYSPSTDNGQDEQLSLQTGGRLLIRGNMVSNAQYADLGIEGHKGESCYFCFPDLSFSVAGYYRLKFQWAWIDHNISSHSHQVRSMGMMGFQISDVFRVYSAKDFPSMLPMTQISLALKRHGLWMRGGMQRSKRPEHPRQTGGKIKQLLEQEEHSDADAP